ncbi:hypothetical protein CGZ80_13830 [Rhodopirellula sp. MGV]|nr:hypothetical protein CGZ80_13830 [Rhodopirellula sp. MGV]PNY34336.1 hypothetical protein C2E31_24225 [Rhodopirellula baltica]
MIFQVSPAKAGGFPVGKFLEMFFYPLNGKDGLPVVKIIAFLRTQPAMRRGRGRSGLFNRKTIPPKAGVMCAYAGVQKTAANGRPSYLFRSS